MHIKFLDDNGDLHVIPKKKMYLSSCMDEDLFQIIVLQRGIDNIEITKAEFERLVMLLDNKEVVK